ncbi:MAG: hypothetical protein R2771_05505 [Saprospiraceae bacterium]
MHFDHVGGAVKYNSGGELVSTFPNATYWTTKKHLDWALSPNSREESEVSLRKYDSLV